MKYKSELISNSVGDPVRHYFNRESDRFESLLVRPTGEDLTDEHRRALEGSIDQALPLIEAAHACEATACDVEPLLSMLNGSLCAIGVHYSWDDEAAAVLAEAADHEDFAPDSERLWLTEHFAELTKSSYWNNLPPGDVQPIAGRVARWADQRQLPLIAEALNQAERSFAARQITHAAAFLRGALAAKG